MRSIPATMQKKLASRVQAGSSALGTSLWVGRPTTPLTEDKFLEKQTVLSSSEITKTSIAVCHPRLMRGATEVYIGYIEAGTAKVTKSLYVEDMPRHIWVDTKFSEWADDISVCFDGTMVKSPNGWVEFKTELSPWVFWTRSGALYGQKLGDSENPLVLAEANCTAVSAVRAMWSSSGGFDFGLVVFFVVDGALYYRQLISGEWMDAEVVSFGPPEVLWEDIAAFRTWDYRVGLQCKSTTGAYYELFTQFMGIGKQASEHIEVNAVSQGSLGEVVYFSAKSPKEHIGISTAATAVATYGLSSKPLRVYNTDDGTGNYGTVILIEMDYPVHNVEGNASAFTLKDGNSNLYTCIDAQSVDGGQTIRLTFLDFNLAEGTIMTLGYTAGNIQSPAVALNDFLVSFAPTLLEAPDIPVPEPVQAWNIDAEGTEIALRFSQPLIGDVTGEDLPVGYVKRNIDLSGVEVTTQNQYSSSYPGTKVIDGNTSTYWRGTSSSNWIQFAFPEAKTIVGLRIYLAEYYVKKFNFQGSNDGSTWTQIGGTYTAASSNTAKWYDFSISNSNAYLYYRINTTSGYSSSRVNVYEVEFQEYFPAGNELKMSISGQAYNYIPGGQLQQVSRAVADVYPDLEDDTLLHLKLNPGITNNLQSLVGDATISYAGGTLRGVGGPVADFSFVFTPVGLSAKNNPSTQEHVSLNAVTASAALQQVFYLDTQEKEHLNVYMSAEADLTHIDDI